MKKRITPILGLLVLALLAPSGHAQIVTVSYVGTTIGGALPGDANDFIFFYNNDYSFSAGHNTNNDAATGYSELSSFDIVTNLTGEPGGSKYSTITSPAGSSILTGVLEGSNGEGVLLEPGNGTGGNPLDTNLNPNFNYNDFNVYLMISNTGGAYTDSDVTIDAFSNVQPNVNGANEMTVTDNTGTTTSTAQFIEFNVSGLGTAIADGEDPNLEVFLNYPKPNTGYSYLGAVSFQSIDAPEPSTCAMMGIGGLWLLWRLSRKSAFFQAWIVFCDTKNPVRRDAGLDSISG